MVQETENKYVFTDSYRTKDLIWDAYFGYIENYNNYMMLSHLGRSSVIVISGLNRYAFDFYYEICEFLDKFKSLKEDADKLKSLINQKTFNSQDYLFFRKFFSKFMVISGIKAIVKDKDERSAFAKSQSE